MTAVRSGDSGDRGASGCEASAGAQIYSSTAECSEGMRRSHDAKTKLLSLDGPPHCRRTASAYGRKTEREREREGKREII